VDEAILRSLHRATNLARIVHGRTATVGVATTAGAIGRGVDFRAYARHADYDQQVTFGETPLVALRKLVEVLEEAQRALGRAVA